MQMHLQVERKPLGMNAVNMTTKRDDRTQPSTWSPEQYISENLNGKQPLSLIVHLDRTIGIRQVSSNLRCK